MKTACIIIEDQPPAQRILQKFIGNLDTLELKGVFSNALDALSFLQQQPIDLIFLDIHLPKISGIDFLKTLHNSPKIILTTAFSEYALESYEYNVVDYLLKPFSFQRFVQAVAKGTSRKVNLQKEKVQEKSKEYFFIKSGYELIKINTFEVLYIKSDGDYTEVITPKKTHLSSETLKNWLEKLDSSIFFQVHKSYILNTKYLQKIVGNKIYLTNNFTIPIGRAYKNFFIDGFLSKS